MQRQIQSRWWMLQELVDWQLVKALLNKTSQLFMSILCKKVLHATPTFTNTYSQTINKNALKKKKTKKLVLVANSKLTATIDHVPCIYLHIGSRGFVFIHCVLLDTDNTLLALAWKGFTSRANRSSLAAGWAEAAAGAATAGAATDVAPGAGIAWVVCTGTWEADSIREDKAWAFSFLSYKPNRKCSEHQWI